MPENTDYLDGYPTAIRSFATYMTVILGRSPKTVREYCLDLRTFCRFLLADDRGIDPASDAFSEINISGMTVEDFGSVSQSRVYDFLYYASNGRGNAAGARARKLSALKSFYKYLTVHEHAINVNPALTIDTPKVKKALPKHLSVEESRDLLTTVEENPESQFRERDFAILTLFLNCGMRLSELAGIDLPDLDTKLRSLRVTGKGAKERIIYLNDACRDALSHYLPIRMATPTKGDRALFLSRLHKRISVKTIQWMVKKYIEEAGLGNRGYSVHKLRHTAATLLYQTGQVDIRVLKEILGHEQLNTTQIYTHVANPDMEAAMQKNPLADMREHLPDKLPEYTPDEDTDEDE